MGHVQPEDEGGLDTRGRGGSGRGGGRWERGGGKREGRLQGKQALLARTCEASLAVASLIISKRKLDSIHRLIHHSTHMTLLLPVQFEAVDIEDIRLDCLDRRVELRGSVCVCV